MKTPGFWKDINFFSNLFAPLGWIYGTVTALRLLLTKGKKVGIPVICIGNLTAGGVGKTPVAISIAKLLKEEAKKNPFFVTRGYGGTLQDVLVNPQKHSAKETGDEPLLLAQAAPTIVNKDRYLGAFRASENGADCIIMDDGFQNPGLHKDVSFVVIDSIQAFGNKRCIPAGPLREFLKIGLWRTKAVILLGEPSSELSAMLIGKTIFKGKIKPVCPQGGKKNVIAFAGIGHPQKFYNSLADCGFNIVKTRDFADHHYYTPKELENLIAEAEKMEADLYTTSKDFVKIPEEMQPYFKVLEIAVELENPDALKRFILEDSNPK